jgi:SAM-dependent methyltransferase
MLNRLLRHSRSNRWATAGVEGVRRLRERVLYRLGNNLSLRASIPSFIAADADYAIQIARGYLQTFEPHFDLSRAAILELGPGINFGPQLILASCGAHITVADRFLSRWHRHYHPRIYRELKARWSGPSAAIDRVLQSNGYPADVMTCVAQPAECLADLADGSFDCVISNAVLEHVYEPRVVAASLARATKAGGYNFHQIDFRDHKDFRRPLEFLLVGAGEYQEQFDRTKGGRGNRWRLGEWTAAFESTGFRVADVQINDVAPEAYFETFVPRLRRTDTVYRDWPENDLRVLGARVCLRR